MNLQESIKKIIKEETSLPLHLRRRVNIDELHNLFNEISDQQAFMMSLISNPNNKTLNKFKKRVIILLIDSIHGELSNWGSTDFDYDGIYDALTDYFLPQIKEKYNEVIDSNNNPTEQELDEYARTLKNARRQGTGLRFPKSAVKANPSRFRKYSREEQTEGEITEKCWAGYTQKGMKTMFGKKYPNCVKKTK